MKWKYTANQAIGLIKLARALSEDYWVPVSSSHRRELGALMELIPTCYEDGVEFFNYANHPYAIDCMLIDLIYDIHPMVRTESQSKCVILTESER